MENIKFLAVAGNPVSHSKSPQLFNAVFETLNSDYTYTRLLCNSAGKVIQLVKELGITGLSVTTPFKEKVMPLLDCLDSSASIIDGVNCITNEDGVLKGYNTDYYGVYKSFEDKGIELKGKNVIVIGTGPAARAAVYGLLKNKADITIINRTVEKAKDWAGKFSCDYGGFEDLSKVMPKADILVSSISVHERFIEPSLLSRDLIIFDANYKKSTLCIDASEKGCKIIKGLDWLLFQAVAAYEKFFSRKISIDTMRRGFSLHVPNRKNITMTGFMASGKSFIGRELAGISGYKFVDMDKFIEEQTGMLINDIFAEKGEEYFRKLETDALRQIMSKKNQIISLGGGTIIRKENREIIKNNSFAIWLYASYEETCNRALRNNRRPLLNVENPREKIRELMAERLRYYAKSSDLLVNSEGKISDIAEMIKNDVFS